MPPPTRLERALVTRAPEETRALAARIAAAAAPGDLVCLFGDLGAGKTEFAKGFAAGLGVGDRVTSPTFVLMAEYPGRLPLFHLDLYRLADAEDALAGGLLDDRQAHGVTLVEWPDRLGTTLPEARLEVALEAIGDHERRIVLRATDERYAHYLDAAAATEARR